MLRIAADDLGGLDIYPIGGQYLATKRVDIMTYPRHLHSHIHASLEDSPVILLTGPRQSGKTTLMTQVGRELGFDFISFDSIASQSAALRDPVGFVDSLKKPVILDEVQRVPEIFLPIKVDVDENRHINGRYALTGSANPLLVPKLGMH